MVRTVQFLAVCWLAVGAAVAKPPKKARTAPCGDYFGVQVLLDRHGFSAGQIDGKPGPNLEHALKAVQANDHLPVTGQADCDTWHALGGDEAGELLAEYTVSEDEVNGPFAERIPPAIPEQAKLPSLAYTSPLERLGEKFHASPRLLSDLNAGKTITAGVAINVPAVDPFEADVKPTPAPQPDVTIIVSREESSLRAVAPDGSLVFFAPVTTGSAHDPLPVGDWKVTGVSWYPPFHYNPSLFWDAKPHDTKTTIKPGPNNLFGVVWIDLNLPHYGLHGTPEPGEIGRAASHGCVRLTNWDAARVVSLVRPGTPVQFR